MPAGGIGAEHREALEAIKSDPPGRVLALLLEWLALGTWAGKPFQVPRAMCQPHFRMQVSTLFLPGSGAPEALVTAVLGAGLHHPQAAVRATAAHLLELLGEPTTVPALLEALHDPDAVVRVQAALALGRRQVPQAASALVDVLLSSQDEALAAQGHLALLQLGSVAVPP